MKPGVPALAIPSTSLPAAQAIAETIPIDGHVPTADTQRLLEKRPDAVDLSPYGSPDMGPAGDREGLRCRFDPLRRVDRGLRRLSRFVIDTPARHQDLDLLSPIALGFIGSLAAGALTAVGAVPVLFGRIPSRATRDLLPGFAAGVMLAASCFSLIIPALDAAEGQFENGTIPAAIVCLAVLLGMGAAALMKEKLPHEHFKTGREGPDAASLRRVWLG